MFVLGIFSGLAATIFQDAGYMFSAAFVKKGGNPTDLWLGTQVIMSVAGVIVLLWIFIFGRFEIVWSPQLILGLAGSAYGSLFGQLFFFRAEKFIVPALISSLMGLRVVLIFLISLIFFHDHYNLWQFIAIILAASSAFILNWQGGKLQLKGMGSLGISLMAYAISDISVMHLVRSIDIKNIMNGAFIGMGLVNVLLFLSVGAFYFLRHHKNTLKSATPFAFSWLVKQIFLYMCYGWIGPVFGNVIMSFRGPIAFAMTAIVNFWKQDGVIQAPIPLTLKKRRIFASCLMSFAIILYSLV